jgi:hypothetical protein
MLWFYTRDHDSLRVETRYDPDTFEYVGILTDRDGREDTRRFPTAKAFREWLVSLDERLLAEQWAQDGAPYSLPSGSPGDTLPE